jgi:NAD(P)-dependent dehydrogenase (short-subunit alcohol dehydrogenase family)
MLKSEKYFMEPSVRFARRVDEIANAVAFLASPLAGFIDGVNLRIDGGLVTSVN